MVNGPRPYHRQPRTLGNWRALPLGQAWIYAASLAPTRRIRTRVADYSIHRLAPSFFGGFETTDAGVRLARPEKALLDVLYLAPARSRLFTALPEVEVPQRFNRKEARRWLNRIPAGPRHTLVQRRLEALLRDAG